MRHGMPIFLMVALALFAVIGAVILGAAIMAGSESSTDTTAQAVTESWWEVGSGWLIGLATLLSILAIAAIFFWFRLR
jgi:uncharacterized membrane protein YhaH (DUF805 family)